MACVLDPDIAVLFFFTRQQKLICRLFAQPKQKNGTVLIGAVFLFGQKDGRSVFADG